MQDFLIAHNPDRSSTLPYLVRLPLAQGPVVLKVKDTWPRTSKIYCHPSTDWPDDPEIVERVVVRSCVRRGAAIDLTLDRYRENRSQFVFTRARGRDVVFWQSARTQRQARPNVATPTARSHGRSLEIVVDSNERYAWKFERQQATTKKRKLTVGDYAIEASGATVGVVERKSLQDLVSTLTGGKLWYLLAELALVEHAAVVVEDRYSQIFKLDWVRPLTVTEGIAEAAVRYPAVPILFCETRQLAQEWSFRFLGAAIEAHHNDRAGEQVVSNLPGAESSASTGPSTREVRSWALETGIDVSDRGRLRPEVWAAYHDHHND